LSSRFAKILRCFRLAKARKNFNGKEEKGCKKEEIILLFTPSFRSKGGGFFYQKTLSCAKIILLMGTLITHGNISLTPALEVFARKEAAKIERFTKRFGSGVIIRMELGRLTDHHKKGPVFRAEINCNIPGIRIGTFRAEAINEDLRLALLETSHQIIEQLKKFRGRLSAKYKKGAREFKRRIREG
jgi:ribosome-associated translation inhibitor RaiA